MSVKESILRGLRQALTYQKTGRFGMENFDLMDEVVEKAKKYETSAGRIALISKAGDCIRIYDMDCWEDTFGYLLEGEEGNQYFEIEGERIYLSDFK